MEFFRRLDRTWARWEGWLTVAVLLSMVFVAGFSAGVRNLTRFDVHWANEMLNDMEWADSYLRKATMWLAFLGASQATYYRKHINIDVLIRIAPLKSKYIMHAIAGIAGGIITLCLAYSLASAVKLNLQERPIEYEVLGDNGSIHVCDAKPEVLKELEGVERPTLFCAARSVINLFGVPAETPAASFQIVVPLLFMIIGFRFLGIGIGAALAVQRGPAALERLEQEEHERVAAVHAAVSGERHGFTSTPAGPGGES
ncbi:MAG TPA: TRAP transporter small permease subunit [Polyangiales bacterium]|nr:TRAP transporter small permease subunit [Polyangiales bacterium]